MSKKRGDAFSAEQDVLKVAQDHVNDSSASIDDVRMAFSRLCEEYEKLLEETKFITKVSDKLEAKLNKANEALQKNNLELSTDLEIKSTEIDKTLQSNKQLRKQKSELDEKQNQLQMTLIIIIAILLVAMVIFIWLLFKFKEESDTAKKSNDKLHKEVETLKHATPPPAQDQGQDAKKSNPKKSPEMIYYYN